MPASAPGVWHLGPSLEALASPHAVGCEETSFDQEQNNAKQCRTMDDQTAGSLGWSADGGGLWSAHGRAGSADGAGRSAAGRAVASPARGGRLTFSGRAPRWHPLGRRRQRLGPTGGFYRVQPLDARALGVVERGDGRVRGLPPFAGGAQ
ncbi:hypothetical protein D187_009615 [Cystobacter fuscus DSM 2262]|uniref:Uncharacterized protein n=1 Tax=Cystobacter fuscus (strain ATCC 25194 / DSM 2262 / NBRC 100088 / M29) TaxID=1242864 RepID=S9Q1H6_CYSF2|nr:hypothetical protein D187_009615 [Cystobacter fuscus DSM 2262]